MSKLFGFSIEDTEPLSPTAVSPVPPNNEDGVDHYMSSGFFGSYVDLEGIYRTEFDLIKRYREMALHPECDSAIEDIINEAFVSDSNDSPVELDLDHLNASDGIKNKIREEFKYIKDLLDFDKKCHEIYRNWYIDGRIYYHKIIDLKAPHEGIQELRYIDAMKMRYVRKEKKLEAQKYAKSAIPQSDNPMDFEWPKLEEFFIYNPKLTFPTGNINAIGGSNGIKIAKDAITYCTSGLVDRNKGNTLGYLHKAIKSLNQLRMIEDSLVIYRLSRAPERRIFYIDVGNLPKVKAEQYLRDVMMRYRNKLVYNADTGEIRDDKKYMAMLEDFWLPRREGGFNLGRSSEILRDEVKFSKFVGRLRKRFSNMFIDMLKTQLLLKNIVTPEDWEIMSEHIQFDFLYDNHFTELKETELMNERLASLATVEPYIGKYYSQDWVRRQVLRQSDDDIREQDKIIKDEIKKGIIPDPNAIEQEMMLDPEGSGGMRPIDPTQLGATEAEPDAALRSMNVDTQGARQDANIVKPKGGEI